MPCIHVWKSLPCGVDDVWTSHRWRSFDSHCKVTTSADSICAFLCAHVRFEEIYSPPELGTIPSSFTPLSIYAPPPLLTERWGYSKRGLRRDGDDNDTSVAIHRGLDDTLVDSQLEYFVVIFRLLDAA